MSQEKQSTIHLPRTASAPATAELRVLLEKAREHAGCKVEQTWSLHAAATAYRVVVRMETAGQSPLWSLKQIDGVETKEIWAARTEELEMVRDVCQRLTGAAPLAVGQDEGRATSSAATAVPSAAAVPSSIALPKAMAADAVMEAPAATAAENDLEGLGEDGSGAEFLNNQLINPRSAFYEYGALLKFLEHEFYRYESYGTPLSLIIFEMSHSGPLPAPFLTTAAMRVALVSRRCDVIAHFEADDYAILCPNTRVHKAALIASKVYETLSATPLAAGFDRNTVKFAFGIAGLPEDGNDIQTLVAAAKIAKSRAKLAAFAISMSRAAV